MDILSIVRGKIDSLCQQDRLLGLKAVVVHIETAEKYWRRAKEENDDNLFTDVLYRTNHAFEGILKEAYSVLTDQDASWKTPYEIENYLLENSVFKPRVMDLFKNYRTQWRNPSTHDHKLFFSEQESFLAIVSVSAFVSILLDQISEHVSFEAEKARTLGRAESIRASVPGYETLPLLHRAKELILAFSEELKGSMTEGSSVTEYEALGMLAGFMASVDPEMMVSSEEAIPMGSTIVRPDLVIRANGEQTIVELKRVMPITENLLSARQQLMAYLVASNTRTGIVYVPPIRPDNSMALSEIRLEVGEAQFDIVMIYPER